MVDISIAQGQGITQAIKTKIEASGQKISNNDLSIWQQVMTEVKTAQQTAQQNGSQIYSGGDDIAQLNNKNNWKTDFKVMGAQVIQIASDVWNKIVQLLTGQAPENLENNPDPVENQQKSSVTSNAHQPQSPEVVEDEPPKGTVVRLNPDNLGISDIVSQPEILSGNMAKNEHPTGPNTPPPVYNETVNPGDLQQAQRVADPLAGQQEHGPVIYQGQEITLGEPKVKVVGLSIDNLSSIVQADVPDINLEGNQPANVRTSTPQNVVDIAHSDGDVKMASGSSSITVPEEKRDLEELYNEFVYYSQPYQCADGSFEVRGTKNFSLSSAMNFAALDMKRLSEDRAMYIALSKQDQSNLTAEDKDFIESYKALLNKMQITIDSEGQFANIEGCIYIKE